MPEEQPADEKYVTRMVAENFKIGDLEMDLSMRSIAGSDRVSRVEFELPHGTRHNPGAAFTDLNDSLTIKYGKPDQEEREEQSTTISHTVKWTFRSTTIALLWIEIRKIDFNIVNLLYTATDKKAVDVL